MLQLPTEDTVRLEHCLPSSRFPSDHLPLFVHLAFCAAPPHASRPAPRPPASALAASADNSPSGSPSRLASSPLTSAPLASGSPLSAAAPPFVCPLSVSMLPPAATPPPPPRAALPAHVTATGGLWGGHEPTGAASPKRTRDGLPVAAAWAEAAGRAEARGGVSGERGGERGGGEHGGGSRKGARAEEEGLSSSWAPPTPERHIEAGPD